MRNKKRKLIETANELVSIVAVCRLLGLDVPDDISGSSKLHCPFEDLYHSDGGQDRAFRVYTETNSCYCFSCQRSYTVVSLASFVWNRPRHEAASDLLDWIDYKPISLAQTWQSLDEIPKPDQDALGLALRTYCARITKDWDSLQFDKQISTKLDKCLRQLDNVNTEEDAKLWLEKTKKIMYNELNTKSL